MLEKQIMMDQPPPGKIYAPILCLEKLTNLSRDCFENIRWGREGKHNELLSEKYQSVCMWWGLQFIGAETNVEGSKILREDEKKCNIEN